MKWSFTLGTSAQDRGTRIHQFLGMLTPEQREKLDQPPAMITHPQHHEANSQIRTHKFHKAMTLPAEDNLILNPSVSLRVLRAKLHLEETLELFEALGVELVIDGVRFSQGMQMIGVEHIEGSQYDIVEAYDAVCDIDVINNGTASALGFVVETGAHEVYCSNMTKLDESGKPIINRCLTLEDPDVDHICVLEPCRILDESKPIGKVLKPAHYRPANMPAILYAQLISESE